MSDMKTVLVTGANAGLGRQATLQLASLPGVQRIYLACRNEDKAKAAITKLEAETGKSMFAYVQLDTSDLNSVYAAIERIDAPLDGIILNAGGMGGPSPTDITPDGVTQCFAVNVLGHAALVEGLIEASKLRGTVVYVGSEAARGIPMARIERPALQTSSTADFAAIADGSLFSTFDAGQVYGHVKYVGTLWTSAMSRKYPALRFVTVSPGATTGTEGARDMSALSKFIMNRVAMPMMALFGRAHGVETGAARYLAVLSDDVYKTGRFYASPWPTTSGALVDQSTFFEDLGNLSFQDNAYYAVRSFLPKS